MACSLEDEDEDEGPECILYLDHLCTLPNTIQWAGQPGQIWAAIKTNKL